MGTHPPRKPRSCSPSRSNLCMQPHYWTIGRGATGWAVDSARLGPWQMGRYRFRICSMLSEPYGSHYIRWRYQTTSRRRRTIIFSHSFFSTASSNFDMLSESPDERAFVVLFVPRPTTFRRDHLPSASVRGPRQPTHLSSPCTPRPTSPGPAQLLQCSRRVRRGRRDQSGRHGRRHGTVCDVPQACRTRRGMLQPPSTLRHLQFSPRPRHAGCDAPRRAAPRMRGAGLRIARIR